MATETIAQDKAATLQVWKGIGYIATGMVLIILALTFSSITLDTLSQHAEINPIAPTAIFFTVLITGTVWGGIIIWKGIVLTELRGYPKSPTQYGAGYRLAKLIIVILSKTIFRRHKWRWQRIKTPI
jgi:hypothetical protein